jgi:predicted alpha-1,2-mannosidase
MQAPDWTIYFCGKFDQAPTSTQAFVGKNQTLSEFGKNSNVSGKDRVGGVFSFKESQVTSRVAVSWTSTKQACRYLDDEMPTGTKLLDVVNASKARWNSEVFAKMTTTDTNTPMLQQLYTSLYGMHLLPSNRTGDNPSWSSSEPYYDDIYTFWDLFRCTTPLFHILQPVAYEELLRSIVDVWRHEGWLPDGRSSNFNGRTQGGSNADNILADAYVKGVRGAVNWDDAYAAMRTDAEKVPPPNNDPSAPDASTKEGRGALADWLQYGYITPKFTRAVTRGVEYAGNDFALHQVAKGLGKNDDAVKYLRRSRNWRNHWNPQAESFGIKGFLVPRTANGSFMKQNPMSCGGCYWREPYYEGKPWEYSVGAHHDMGELITMSGGPQNFTQRLDILMDLEKKIFNPGNEPSFTTPYLYNFVGRQDLSVKQSRKVAKTFYSAGVGGLPGASDAGLYPITGQTTFLVGSPWFQQLSVSLPNGKALNLTTSGGDSNSNFYVQSLKVNGQPWNKNWVTWDDIFADGGSMEFELGSSPVRWDTGGLPPSPASKKSGTGDNGGAAKITPPGPQVLGEVPVPHSDRHLRIAAIIVGVIGFVTIFSGIFVYAWLRRSRGLQNKDQAADAEKSTANGEGVMETKRKEAVVRIREIDVDTSDSGSDAGSSRHNMSDGQQTQRAEPAPRSWNFWKRRRSISEASG